MNKLNIDDLDGFTRAYLECALWSSLDDNGENLDDNYSIEDIAEHSIKVAIIECKKFQDKYDDLIKHNYRTAGHDFWLTRSGHGAGFWDGDWPEHGDTLTEACKEYGDNDPYVEDGIVHIH